MTRRDNSSRNSAARLTGRVSMEDPAYGLSISQITFNLSAAVKPFALTATSAGHSTCGGERAGRGAFVWAGRIALRSRDAHSDWGHRRRLPGNRGAGSRGHGEGISGAQSADGPRRGDEGGAGWTG